MQELAKRIRQIALLLLVSGLFMLVTLDAPDADLVRADALINWPIIRTEVPLSTMLLYAPVTLIAILIYLHLFYGRLLKYRRQGHHPGESYVFTMTSPGGRLATDLMFYAYVPLVLVFFTWRVMFRPEAKILASATVLTIFGCALLCYLRRLLPARDWPEAGRLAFHVGFGIVFAASVVALTVFMPMALGSRQELLARFSDSMFQMRKIDLKRADLGISDDQPHVEWSRLDLRHADMRFATISGADLRGTRLSNADMRDVVAESEIYSTDFTGVNMDGARMERIRVSNALFNKASLNRAKLARAVLSETDFIESKLREADFAGARFETDVTFFRADLTGALLNQTVFAAAPSFAYASLDRSQFDGARLEYGGAFNFASLNGACFSDATLLNVRFNGAGLASATFEKAVIGIRKAGWAGAPGEERPVTFLNADLRNASFAGAYLGPGADFARSDLTGATFAGSNLVAWNGRPLAKALDGACLCRTILPDGSRIDRDCGETAEQPFSCRSEPVPILDRPPMGCTADLAGAEDRQPPG
ncbi:pentapeptide repeat-containing protein [Poseidonocella sp. HB161398]|uniref:pentapeptide repeat-containing protein n=1 Tax=Poseidonocella sp. HB161398 TaxID=2320855 RepID=UPI00148721D7|nr:pentapeptide repeat-containing protein [Poseidonocella sp. HB161398]